MEEKNLELLKEVVNPHVSLLEQARNSVLDQEISKYPIFIVSRKPAQMGVPLLNTKVEDTEWFAYVSTLEEFATKQLIEMSKVNDFIEVYKSKKDQFCVFFVENIGATFVFLPVEK